MHIKKIFLFIFSILISIDFSNASNYEVYKHPDILKVNFKRPFLTDNNVNLIDGALHAIALMFEAYPKGTLFYFLARDAEYLYDIARYFSSFKEYSRFKNNLRLINVSTALSTDNQLKNYLDQEGINEKALKSGQHYVFVETGFMGSVPENIILNFPNKYRDNFRIFLLDSENLRIPEVSSFMHFGSARDFEKLPHMTSTALMFSSVDGKIHPVSKKQDEGELVRAKRYIAGLIEYLKEDETKNAFDYIISRIKKLKKSKTQASGEIDKLLERDLFELMNPGVSGWQTDVTYHEKKLSAYNLTDEDARTQYRAGLIEERWSNLNKNFDFFLKKVEIFKMVQDFSAFIFSKNVKNKKGQIKFFQKLLEHIDYDKYELLELLVASFTPDLFEASKIKIVKDLINLSIEFEAEEAIEKLLWFISLQDIKVIVLFEKEFIQILENNSIFDRPIYALKIIANNILTLDKIMHLPVFYEKFVYEILDGEFSRHKSKVIDIWNNDSRRTRKLTSKKLAKYLDSRDLKDHLDQGRGKRCVIVSNPK